MAHVGWARAVGTIGAMTAPLVPDDFVVPLDFDGPEFRLEPLGPQHNERDYDAWMSRVDHIRATPDFPDGSWPSPMSLEDNLGDLVRHAEDFTNRKGFTYSVLDGDDIIGCVYIYPSREPECDASAQSWVRVSRAEMDVVLWRAMTAWLDETWPFANVEYGARQEV